MDEKIILEVHTQLMKLKTFPTSQQLYLQLEKLVNTALDSPNLDSQKTMTTSSKLVQENNLMAAKYSSIDIPKLTYHKNYTICLVDEDLIHRFSFQKSFHFFKTMTVSQYSVLAPNNKQEIMFRKVKSTNNLKNKLI